MSGNGAYRVLEDEFPDDELPRGRAEDEHPEEASPDDRGAVHVENDDDAGAEEDGGGAEVQDLSNLYLMHGQILRYGPYVFFVVSIVFIVQLLTGIIVDSKTECSYVFATETAVDVTPGITVQTALADIGSVSVSEESIEPEVYGKEPPLFNWAIAETVIFSLMAVINGLLCIMFVGNPGLRENPSKSFKIVNVVSYVIDAAWIISLIAGTVIFVQFSGHPCARDMYFLLDVSSTVILAGFILMATLVCGCCTICLVFLLRFRVLNQLLNQQGGAAALPINTVTRSTVEALPEKKFKKGMLPEDDSQCAICLLDYEEDEMIRILPCHHHFHTECIDEWLKNNITCPFCKHPINQPYSGPDSQFVQSTRFSLDEPRAESSGQS